MVRKEFSTAFVQISNDDRVTVWHISIYIAILFIWYENGYKNPVPVTRKWIMRLAHISSIATYHKCIRELQEFGYLIYSPSFNPSVGSRVSLFATLNN